MPDFWHWRNKQKEAFSKLQIPGGPANIKHRFLEVFANLLVELQENIDGENCPLYSCYWVCCFTTFWSVKKYAAELHEEGNIVDIEYYMRLVHNYDEKKKKTLCNSWSHVVVILCCSPWMKISVLSSQRIIHVFRRIHVFLSCMYMYVYFGKYCLFF